MPVKGVMIPRAAQHLPVELVQRRSDLDVLITLAGDGFENKTFGHESTAKIVRRVIRQNCSSYRPSANHPNDVLCASGEENGEPLRGSACFKCRASQFSATGFFTGDTNETQHTVINPVIAEHSTATLYDFIKALEESV